MEIRKVALTVSPQLQRGNPVPILKHHCSVYLYSLVNVGEFEIYPEFADNGRLHYHGIVHIKDPIKWYKHCLPTLNNLGFVVVKNNINEGWEEYIKKNWAITQRVFELEGPINRDYVIEQHNLFKKKQNLIKDYIRHLDGLPTTKQAATLIDQLNKVDDPTTQKTTT